MHDLFDKLEHLPAHQSPSGLILVDSCFLIDVFERNKHKQFEDFCDEYPVAITSFNAEEVSFNVHRFREKTGEYLKHFLKSNPGLKVVDIEVKPGNADHEKRFVERVEPSLLSLVHDPSDAVLVATAITAKATILTKDKHHLFTTQLANFLNHYDINVYKELKDVF